MADADEARRIAWALKHQRAGKREWAQAPPTGDTVLTPEQEAEFFLQWKPQHAPRDSGYDYDHRGAYLADKAGTLPPMDDRGHGTDTFKKPWHPTYSTGSGVPPLDGMTPGTWGQTAEGQPYFEAGSQNLQFQSPEELQRYFAEVEPGVALRLPPQLESAKALRARKRSRDRGRPAY